MAAYFIKRAAMTIIVLLCVTVFLTMVVHIIPGDPAKVLLGPRATPELVAKVRSSMGLDKPATTQIGQFLWNAVQGDFGRDVFSGRSITELIRRALPHTLILAWCSLGLAVLAGIPLGVYSATHPDSWGDRITAALSISFITIPSYVSGLFLLLGFSVELGLFPVMGAGDLDNPIDYARHLVLPTVALGTPWIGFLARLVRASLLEVLSQTYIRAATAAGLSQRLIWYKYALKNALIPAVAVLGIGVGKLMGGAVLLEVIFSRPGMGTLLFHAIEERNYPILRAGVLVVAFLFVGANLATDVLYTYLDPRIRVDRIQS